MRAILSALLILSFHLTMDAQLSYGGKPLGYSAQKLGSLETNKVRLPEFDVQTVRDAHDILHATGKGPYYFGKNFDTDINLTNSGMWDILPNGDHLWRVSITSAQAKSINFEFHEFEIPEGGQVFVYTPDMKHVLGAYDQRNRVEDNGRGVLGVQALPGDEIIIEYREPANKLGEGKLKIGQVTHAYRDIWKEARGLGDSGACNINVICPIADDYRLDISSVAIITTGGNGFCTGTLINNCDQDTTPYFLTADHCLSGSVATWTFRFHWESPDCAQNLNGPTNYTVSGATLLLNDAGTDVALLEFATQVPDTFNVCYAGWDHSGVAPDSTYAIHHPSGDVKKFSADYDPVTPSTFSGASCWEVSAWDQGTTEPGSSGSGIWSNSGHLIGQLFGGSASCTQLTGSDFYGRIDVSWPLLEPFLGTCGPILDRYCGLPPTVLTRDVGISSVQDVDEIYCDTDFISPKVTIKNHGSQTIDSVTINWQWIPGMGGNTIFYTSIASGQTANFFMPPIAIPSGKSELAIYTANPNNNIDQNPMNDTVRIQVINYNPSEDITFKLTLDNFGTETTWQLHDADGYQLDEGGPYTNSTGGVELTSVWCLGDGCYTLTLHDTFGDGICCAEGYGDYAVTDSLGTPLIAANPSFGATISHQFCLLNVSVPESEQMQDLRLFPNPNNGIFNLEVPQEFVGGNLRVYNAVGQVVHTNQLMNLGLVELALKSATGIYMVEVQKDGKRILGRVLVR